MNWQRFFLPGATLLLAVLPLASAAAQQSAGTVPPSSEFRTVPDSLDPEFPVVTLEDWSKLDLRPSDFALVTPVTTPESGTEKFHRELVQLKWRAGDPIELYVVRPVGVSKPPIIVLLYGYTESLERFKSDRYCEMLVAHGFAVAGFESALAIDRFRARPMRQWFVSELQEALGASVHDVQLVLNYLETRGDVDAQQAAIFGQGSGGPIAILSAAVDPRLKAVDTLNPWGDWPDWLAKSAVVSEQERAPLLTPEFLAKVKPLEPVDWMGKLKARALRLQYAADVAAVPEATRAAMEAAAAHDSPTTNFTVVNYKEMHELVEKNSGHLFDWIKEQLKSGSTSAAAPSAAGKTESTH